jgi:AraC-like DNA-binding protein
LRAWTLGPSAVLMRLDLAAESARIVQRVDVAAGGTVPERISVAVNTRGTALSTSRQVEYAGRGLRLLDTSADFEIRFAGDSQAVAYEIDTVAAGLDVDSVRRACGRVEASPVRDLVRRHVLGMVRPLETMDAASAIALGGATADIVRSLVLSVSPRDADRRRAAAESLRARVEDFVLAHLHDPSLTPASLAAAHHVSLRQLYLVLSDTGRTPAEWIMQLRLERAGEALRGTSDTVSTVAQRCGFKDHSHFTRRFKNAYGVTPTEFARQRTAG